MPPLMVFKGGGGGYLPAPPGAEGRLEATGHATAHHQATLMDTHMTDKGACCTSCIFFCGKREQRNNRVGEYRNPVLTGGTYTQTSVTCHPSMQQRVLGFDGLFGWAHLVHRWSTTDRCHGADAVRVGANAGYIWGPTTTAQKPRGLIRNHQKKKTPGRPVFCLMHQPRAE